MGNENKLLRQISKLPSISLVFFPFCPLFFNLTLPKKKIQLSANLDSNELNCAK
jgi:hypothetical protein